MTDPLNLAELIRLHEAATEGDWLQGTGSGGGATTYVYEMGENGKQSTAIMGGTLNYVLRPFAEREANAAFIAAIKTAFPAIRERLEVDEWWPIAEIPPSPHNPKVLIYDPRWGVAEGLRMDSGKWGLATFNGQIIEAHPTHYRPLPPPPAIDGEG